MSRIDYFFTTLTDISRFQHPRGLPRGISDHTPLWIELTLQKRQTRGPIIINPWLLKIPDIRDSLTTHTDYYFAENIGSVNSAKTIWEAYKTVIKGHALKTGYIKKHNQQITQLESEILQLEHTHRDSPTEEIAHKLQTKQLEYKALAREKTQAKLLRTHHRVYELGEQTGKMLAWLKKRDQAARWVHKLILENDHPITDPNDIAEAFADHLETVYTAKSSMTSDDSRQLLGEMDLPTLTENDRDVLDADLTVEEICKAIYSVRSGKAMGPNGISIEFLKAMASKVAPHLLTMYEESLEQGILPQDQRLATIVVIHKTGKPTTKCESYRPISLISSEAKVLAKLLAARLIPILSSLVNEDQSGFIAGRNTALSIRRVHNVLSRKPFLQEDAVILSLDASMAFDSIEWPYLFKVLTRLGFGPKFRKWVALLYNDPLGQVRVNNHTSRTLTLRRGTGQGYPLSPLLFALTLEPLAHWIRKDVILRGLCCSEDMEDRISLYADDVLIYLASPNTSINRLFSIVTNFGKYAGYAINWSKSTLYTDPPQPYPGDTPLKRLQTASNI